MKRINIALIILLAICVFTIEARAENAAEKKTPDPGYAVIDQGRIYAGQQELAMQLKQARKSNDLTLVREIEKQIIQASGQTRSKTTLSNQKSLPEFRIIPGNQTDDKTPGERWGNDVIVAASGLCEVNCHLASSLDGTFLYASYELWDGSGDPDQIRTGFSVNHGQSGWGDNTMTIDEPYPLVYPCNTIASDTMYFVFNSIFSTLDADIHIGKAPVGSVTGDVLVVESTIHNIYLPCITTDIVDYPSNYYLYVTASDITDGLLIFYCSEDHGLSWSSQPIGSITAGIEASFSSIAYAEGTELLHVVYVGVDNNIWYTRSPNFGTSWTTPIAISGGPNYDFLPCVAAKGDFVIAVYDYDYDGAGDWDIMYSYSVDGGTTWSTDHWLAGSTDMEFLPSVSVDLGPGSAVYVSYFDFNELQIRVEHADMASPEYWMFDGVINDSPDVMYQSIPVIAATYDPANNHGAGIVWCHEYSATDYDLYFDASWMLGIEEEADHTARNLNVNLQQNRPNPFNRGTSIKYLLPISGNVDLQIYDIQGRRIKKLFDEPQSAGFHTVYWNGQDTRGNMVPSGIYFYRLTTDDQTCVKTMTVCR